MYGKTQKNILKADPEKINGYINVFQQQLVALIFSNRSVFSAFFKISHIYLVNCFYKNG
ncbi:hypothetical protein JZI54_00035 [Streptococcus equi subsp. equi]|uniref:hypothetical protein n=1 Tax=Streptococcus equi TaxID=1336 RepID=UPI001BEBE4E1|nr:hypothetical protein [Streptococcus equi]QWB18116.1 hypothetical protein JZI54_00035 [Streptococcus equi subsp. equi]